MQKFTTNVLTKPEKNYYHRYRKRDGVKILKEEKKKKEKKKLMKIIWLLFCILFFVDNFQRVYMCRHGHFHFYKN